MDKSVNYSTIVCPHVSKELTAPSTCNVLRGSLIDCKDCDWNTPGVYDYAGWQICPKCQGQGKVWFPPGMPWNNQFVGNGEPFECDVCKGKKIIDISTGKPPA